MEERTPKDDRAEILRVIALLQQAGDKRALKLSLSKLERDTMTRWLMELIRLRAKAELWPSENKTNGNGNGEASKALQHTASAYAILELHSRTAEDFLRPITLLAAQHARQELLAGLERASAHAHLAVAKASQSPPPTNALPAKYPEGVTKSTAYLGRDGYIFLDPPRPTRALRGRR